MAYFPFFIDIKGIKGIIVGGGRVAKRKIEKLLPFGPKLTVIAPEILPSISELPEVCCKYHIVTGSDLEGAMFVVAASDDEEVNAWVSRFCQERGILVNVVDDKEKCGFLFPALVKEGSLTVGVSTGGASPQVAASIRSRIAEELPCRIDQILDYLAALRPLAKEWIAEEEKRALFLKEMAVCCMASDRVPSAEETQAEIIKYADPCHGRSGSDDSDVMGDAAPLPGVILAGAGCGAYELITVRGLNALRKAEVLVYDDLIDPRLLSHTPESCEKIYVGKRSGRHSMGQEEINDLLAEKAKTGKRVVRLKGGDPFVFGRGSEEMAALKEQGIPVSEIPGITSAVAVPAAAGIPVTHRGLSRSFHVITGHTMDDTGQPPEKWETLSALEGTCVFLMGLSRLPQITENLISHGKDPLTPAAVVQGYFSGGSRSVRGNLADIAEKVKEAGFGTPAVIVVGDTAGMDLGTVSKKIQGFIP